MLLLTSNAYNIFWLGRYLARIHFLCQYLPLEDDQHAQQLISALYLPAYDAASLTELLLDPEQPASFNQQFQMAYDNVQALRGVLSAQSYAELNAMFKYAKGSASSICQVISDVEAVLESESHDVFLFFSLGKYIESLDQALRMQQDPTDVIHQLEIIAQALQSYACTSFLEAWQAFKLQPELSTFHGLNTQLQQSLGVVV